MLEFGGDVVRRLPLLPHPGRCRCPHHSALLPVAQGWAERAVFGKIRYMNFNGCKRKFDIDKYCARVDALVHDAKVAAAKAGSDK